MSKAWIRRDLPQSLLILINISVVIICGITSICSAAKLPKQDDGLDNSCFDNDGLPYIGRIPHSTTCSMYFKCEVIGDGPVAVSYNCEPGLSNDLMRCDCFDPSTSEVICFDPSNADHAANRLRCAEAIPPRAQSSSVIRRSSLEA